MARAGFMRVGIISAGSQECLVIAEAYSVEIEAAANVSVRGYPTPYGFDPQLNLKLNPHTIGTVTSLRDLSDWLYFRPAVVVHAVETWPYLRPGAMVTVVVATPGQVYVSGEPGVILYGQYSLLGLDLSIRVDMTNSTDDEQIREP